MCEICATARGKFDPHKPFLGLANEIGDVPAGPATTALVVAGAEFVGSIEANGDRDWIRVSLVEGNVYDISLTGSGAAPLADPILRLRDSEGVLLATNDDTGGSGNRNSLLDDFEARYTGDYYIEAAGYGDRYAGGYTVGVALEREAPPPDSIPADANTTASMAVGGRFEGALETMGDRDWIRIDLETGKSYDIALTGSGGQPLFDPILRVYDRDGNLLVTRDDIDGQRNRNSFLDEFFPRYTGTYFIEAAAFGDKHAGGYAIEVTPGDSEGPYTIDQIATYLSSGFWQDFLELDALALQAGEDRVVTYNISKLTAAGKQLAVEAFRVWSDVTGLDFRRVTDAAMIDFDDIKRSAFADIENTGTVIDSVAINIGRVWLREYGTALDSYSFQTYIHEIGHALGLGHAGNYNGSARYPDDALYPNDSWQATVMSYFDQQQNWFINGSTAFLLTPMQADIVAVQSIYGFAGETRRGDTVYGHGATAGRLFDPQNFTSAVAWTIFDSGGQDRLSGALAVEDQFIDLRPEGISDIFGLTGKRIDRPRRPD